MDQTVLITPLGWERDRASCLGEELRVHKTYLLYRTDHDENQYFADKVKEDLENQGTEVKLIELNDNCEFESVLFNVSKLIVKEYNEHNIVYVNMSASGKIAAAAATIASMFHKDKIKSLIYVSAKSYSVHQTEPEKEFRKHGLAIGMEKRYSPPLFHIERPSEPILKTIILLYEEGRPMKYEELLDALKKLNVPSFENFSYTNDHNRKREISKWTARLRRNVLNPIENLYIEIIPSHEGPEKLVRLTLEGKHLAILTGMVSNLKKDDYFHKIRL